MKLVRPERHSLELSGWLAERSSHPVLSSVLIEVELVRATHRSAPGRLGRVPDILRGIGIVSLSPAVVARATGYDDPHLPSLDAIHLATAQHVVALTATALEGFVAYDARLLDSARVAGLPVVAPGQS